MVIHLSRLYGMPLNRAEAGSLIATIAKQMVALMGRTGAGKSTLIRCVNRMNDLVDSVRIEGGMTLNGDPIYGRGVDVIELRKRMGMMFQSGALLTDLTVYDNVAFPIREHTRLPERLVRDLVLMKLQAVGLRGAAGLMPNELSGGMARRVAMARAIALDPTIVLYDEPFTGQDPISMGVLLKLIRELNDALGLTSIVVSHDVKETASIADYAYLLSGGKVVDQGVPESLRSLLFLPLVTGRRDGTGLGLSLSQQIAAAHGGMLTYEPRDRGSCFSLYLPFGDDAASPASEDHHEHH